MKNNINNVPYKQEAAVQKCTIWQTHHFCIHTALLIILISHIAQALLTKVCKFYCFCPDISFILPNDGRSISQNVASLNILVRDMINLLYYEH